MAQFEEPSGLRIAAVIGAFLVGFACLFGVAMANLTLGLGCHGDSATCNREGMHYTQLWIAIGGLVPAGLLIWATITRRNSVAFLALALTVLVYLAWGLVNDAAVHGWHNLEVY